MTMDKTPTLNGREPDSMHVTFTGKDEHLDVAFEHREEVIGVIRGYVAAHNFRNGPGGSLRLQQQIKVDSLVLLDSDQAAEYLAKIKEREDEAMGQASLDADIDAALDAAEEGDG